MSLLTMNATQNRLIKVSLYNESGRPIMAWFCRHIQLTANFFKMWLHAKEGQHDLFTQHTDLFIYPDEMKICINDGKYLVIKRVNKLLAFSNSW